VLHAGRGVPSPGPVLLAGGGRCSGAFVSLGLDGEGVFEALHAHFQILDLPVLLGRSQVFDSIQPFRDLYIKGLHRLVQCLHVLCAGHGALNPLG
jgi:hypothetical protein